MRAGGFAVPRPTCPRGVVVVGRCSALDLASRLSSFGSKSCRLVRVGRANQGSGCAPRVSHCCKCASPSLRRRCRAGENERKIIAAGARLCGSVLNSMGCGASTQSTSVAPGGSEATVEGGAAQANGGSKPTRTVAISSEAVAASAESGKSLDSSSASFQKKRRKTETFRRTGVSAEKMTLPGSSSSENSEEITLTPKSETVTEQLLAALTVHPLFEHLPKELMHRMCRARTALAPTISAAPTRPKPSCGGQSGERRNSRLAPSPYPLQVASRRWSSTRTPCTRM